MTATRQVPASATASSVYAERSKAIADKLARLKKALAAHKKAQKTDPGNWGFTGELGHLDEQLGELVKWMSA